MDVSPAKVIAKLLVDLGLASDPASWLSGSVGNPWPVLTTGEPSQPDNCITVRNTQGVDHGETMVDNQLQQHYGYAFRVRSDTEANGWSKVDAIRTMLATVQGRRVTVGTHVYLVWACVMKQVLTIGTDAPSSKRNLHTLNGLSAIDQLS